MEKKFHVVFLRVFLQYIEGFFSFAKWFIDANNVFVEFAFNQSNV